MVSPNWLQGADSPEERNRRSDLVRHSEATLNLLAAVARVELDKLGTAPFADYDSPNWAFKEADRKGQVRVWRNILLLCNQPIEGKHNG